MSAHRVVTAMEDEAIALGRLRLTGRADVDLANLDESAKRLRALIRRLRPLIGTVEPRFFGAAGTSEKGRPFTVARRRRAA